MAAVGLWDSFSVSGAARIASDLSTLRPVMASAMIAGRSGEEVFGSDTRLGAHSGREARQRATRAGSIVEFLIEISIPRMYRRWRHARRPEVGPRRAVPRPPLAT